MLTGIGFMPAGSNPNGPEMFREERHSGGQGFKIKEFYFSNLSSKL
jgi:hypothetical protein